MHWSVRGVIRFFEGFAAGLMVIAGFGLWILSRGPITLDLVAPYVAELLSRDSGFAVGIDHTLLTLSGGRVVVFARGVHLRRNDGGAALTLSDLALEFSPRAALSGVIAPTRIVVNRPELRLVRDADGTFHLGIGDATAGTAEDWGQRLVDDLVHPPDNKGTLGFLTELSVQDASLTVDDRAFGVEWHASGATAVLRRAQDRTNGYFRVAIGQGAGNTTLDGDFTLLPAIDQLVVRLAFNALKPSQWSDAAPSLAGLAALDLPVSGELRAEFDPARLKMRDAIADLQFGRGELKHAALAGGTLSVADGALQAGYDAEQGRINLGLLSFDLNPGNVSASGTIDSVGGDFLAGGQPQALDLSLALAAHAIRVDDFPRLWPEQAAVNPRRWATQHLSDGIVDDVEAQLGLHIDLSPDAAKPAELREFSATMAFSNLSVEYFRPLPPVRNVVGTGRFSPTEIEFTASSGDLGNIHASAATARFYKLDTHDEQAKITVTTQGALADALGVLDTAPLYYAHEIGLDPKRAGGTFTARLDFALPLVNDLELKDVDYRADATLANVSLGNVAFQRDLGNGALKLKLDHVAAQIDGTAELAGVPLTLSWRESLEPKAAVRAHYNVKARLDDAQRKSLGLDVLEGLVAGPVAVDADYDIAAQDRARATATLDLKDATLDLAKLNVKKAAGVPATGRFALDLLKDKVTAIRDATLQGSGLDAKWAVSFDDQGVSGITVDHVVAGNNDFHGSVARGATGGWQVAAAGKSLDASGLFDELDKNSAGDEKSPPLSIEANLDRLVVAPDREARAVAASLVSNGVHWQRLSIDMKLSDKTSASLKYNTPLEDRQFKLTTDDFGALLKLLGIYDDIAGGKFDLTGRAVDRDGRRVLVTTADGSDYRVVQAPTLARLLSLASFSGINALLTGQGIPFNRLQGDVEFDGGKITLTNARAYGGAIGINASGVVNRDAGQMNVSGTLVPAYTLNSVIGDIPLLGNLLVGGAGQGLFSSNFRVFGPIDKPDVSVNALSTLAPGMLRNLFLFSPRGP